MLVVSCYFHLVNNSLKMKLLLSFALLTQYILTLSLVYVPSTLTSAVLTEFNGSCSDCLENSYQHITVEGLPYVRGKSHGNQAKEKIIANLNHYKSSPSMPEWKDCISFVNKNYMKAMEKYFPSGLEEMRGIADGANVTLHDIIILNARYDLTRWKRSQSLSKHKKCKKATSECNCEKISDDNDAGDETSDHGECTGAVALKSATKKKEVLLSQNWDTSAFILNNDTAILLEVRPHPSENIEPFVMLTEAGQLRRSGMNAKGLGIIAMSLWSSNEIYESNSDGDRFPPDGWVPATLLRRMFLEAPTFPVGIRNILRTPVHVSVNMMIATEEDEALNIELTPDDYFVTEVPIDKEILTHSNHFKSQSFKSRDDIREGSHGGSSLFRDRRVNKHLHSAEPLIDSGTFQQAFKDHVGHPNAVCEHSVPKSQSWMSTHYSDTTVASVIYNLSQRTLQFCKGPPCKGTLKKFIFPFSVL